MELVCAECGRPKSQVPNQALKYADKRYETALICFDCFKENLEKEINAFVNES